MGGKNPAAARSKTPQYRLSRPGCQGGRLLIDDQIVQATGTGKTRVAISLCDALIDAGWARRVLFLCDRRELRKQAKENFQRYLDKPLVYVTANTYRQREQRQQLEEDEVNPESVEYESHEIDKKVFNLDTNGLILENLMANGIKDATSCRREFRDCCPTRLPSTMWNVRPTGSR